jgi:hypothetical protein
VRKLLPTEYSELSLKENSMAPLTGAQFEALQAAIVAAFSAAELAQVVRFKLGRRLDALVNINNGADQVVFELIGCVERQGWTEEFIRGVYEARRDNAGIKEYCEGHARFVFTPPASTSDLTRLVGAGLESVANRLDDSRPAIRAIITQEAKSHLLELAAQFVRVRKYKVLHDCLHNLQFKYLRLINSGLKLFRESPDELDNIRIVFAEMADELEKTRPEINGLPSATAESLWMNVADEAVRRLRAGVDANNSNVANAGYQLLEGLLRVQPTRINELLIGVLEDLGLNHLLTALTNVRDRLNAPALTEPLTVAINAVGNLSPRLNRVTYDHKDWQLVDNTLLQIDTDLKIGYSVEQSAFLWQEADRILQPLLEQDRTAPWARELSQLAWEFKQALEGANAEGVKTTFRRLRPRAMWYFFQADTELKKLSAVLIKIGDQLDQILKGAGDGN